MLWRVQRAGAAIQINSKGDERKEGAENDGRLYHAVVVELAQELCTTDPPLVKLRLVHLRIDSGRIRIQMLHLIKDSYTSM